MLRKIYIIKFYIIIIIALAGSNQSFAVTGYPNIHDPSPIVKDGNKYWVFGTANGGIGIYTAYSTDLINWTQGPRIFAKWPSWINTYVSKFSGDFWAPHVTLMNGKYYLYYACSSWGTFYCALGVATSPTLDPNSPDYKWTDLGMVAHSSTKNEINSIDSYLFQDNNGKAYLSYGTFNGGGVTVVEIDKSTGKIVNGSNPKIILYGTEGSAIIKNEDYYYIIGNRGTCCSGLNSTYYMIMGRSKNPLGPYLDKNGKNMATWGAGTTLLSSSGKYLGPGQFGLYTENGINFVSMHYYDKNDKGVAKLDIATLGFKDGWPYITRDWLPKGSYSISGKESGKVWEAAGCSGTSGNIVIQNTIFNNNCQKWDLSPLGDGYYSLTSALTGTKSLEVMDCSTNNGAKMQVGNTANNGCQKFKLDRAGDGSFVLTPSNTNKLVEAPKNSLESGQQLFLSDYNGFAGQKWKIVSFGSLVTGVEESGESNERIKCYPNPFSESTSIDYKGKFSYTIYNVLGIEVEQGEGENKVNVGNSISSGFYLVKIQTQQGSKVLNIYKN